MIRYGMRASGTKIAFTDPSRTLLPVSTLKVARSPVKVDGPSRTSTSPDNVAKPLSRVSRSVARGAGLYGPILWKNTVLLAQKVVS